MKRTAKIVLIVFVILAIAASVAYSYLKPLDIETVVIEPHDATLYFTEQGFVKDTDKLDVYSALNEKVKEVRVERNQFVNAGDVICVIDDTNLKFEIERLKSEIKSYNAQISNVSLEENRQKDSMKFDIESMQAEYNALLVSQDTQSVSKSEQLRLQNIVVEQNKKDYALAEDTFEKFTYLMEHGLVSEKEYNEVKQAASASKSALDSSMQQLEVINNSDVTTNANYNEEMKSSLSAKISGMQNALAKSYSGGQKAYYASLVESANTLVESLNKKIDDCTVKAPISGTITELGVKNANMVSPQIPVATISSGGIKEIEVYVSTLNRDDIRENDSVVLTAERQQGDVDFNGKVTGIENEAVIKISPLGVEERKVLVKVAPEDNIPVTLDPGFDVTVKFTTLSEKNKITAPKTAVFNNPENLEDYVWVVRDGKAAKSLVKLGVELRTEYIIDEGLQAGDIVIKDANDSSVKEGVRIANAAEN